MKRIASLAMAGVLAASAMAFTVDTADAGKRWHGPPRHKPPVVHHHHHNNGSGLAAGLFLGLTAATIGHALIAPAPPAYYPPPTYYPPQPGVPAPSAHSQWCATNYPSYDFHTNTIVDMYGVRRPCYSPYN